MSISQFRKAEEKDDLEQQMTRQEAEIQRLQEYADNRDVCIDLLVESCNQKEAELVTEKVKTKIMSILCATLTASALLYIFIINYF